MSVARELSDRSKSVNSGQNNRYDESVPKGMGSKGVSHDQILRSQAVATGDNTDRLAYRKMLGESGMNNEDKGSKDPQTRSRDEHGNYKFFETNSLNGRVSFGMR